MAGTDFTSRIDPGVAITMLDHALHIQMTYGAVMLSFLGALHWGLEFAGYGGQKGCVLCCKRRELKGTRRWIWMVLTYA